MRKLLTFPDTAHATLARATAAVQVWLDATVLDGGWPADDWGPAEDAMVDRAEAANQEHEADGEPLRWSTVATTPLLGHWVLDNAGWDDVLHSLIADVGTPGLHGAAAQSAITNVRTASSRVRVATFTLPAVAATDHREARPAIEGVVAAVVLAGTLHLFDPRAGLYEVPTSGQGRKAPLRWFRHHMDTTYGQVQAGLACLTHVVDVRDVFFTWFGPPVAPVAAGDRPDLKGPVALATADFGSAARPRVKFCCLRAHVDAFDRDLRRALRGTGRRVEVIAVEDQFAGGLQPPTSPLDFNDLPRAVAGVIHDSVADLSNTRGLVNAKNVWSLFVLWRYGGYHFDTGVVLAAPGQQVTLPEPTQFATMWVDLGKQAGINKGAGYDHVVGTFGNSGVTCAMLAVDPHQALRAVWTIRPDVAIDVRSKSNITFELIDVGLLRSPRRARGVELALRFYLDTWWRIDALGAQLAPMGGVKQAYREAIVGAAATGIAHHRTVTRGCGYERPKPGSEMFLPSDLGLRKTGQQSHRDQPVVQP